MTPPRIPNHLAISPVTTTVGQQTISVTGQDLAGNQTTQSCDYRVVYKFTGFSAPLSAPPNQYVNATVGRNIPFRFVVTDGQNAPVAGLDSRSSVVVTDVLDSTLCSGSNTTLLSSDCPKGKSGLIEIGNGNYEYRWKAPRSAAGQCHGIGLMFNDGVVHSIGFLFVP